MIKHIQTHILFIEIAILLIGLGLTLAHDQLKRRYGSKLEWFGIFILIIGIIFLLLTVFGKLP